MTDSQLERLLERTAASMVYPPGPDLRGEVLASLAPKRREGFTIRPPSFALAALLLLLVVAAAAAIAVAPDRNAIARFFGIEGSKIEVAPPGTPVALPTSPAASVPLNATPRSSRNLRAFATPAALPELGRQRLAPVLPDVADELQGVYYVVYGEQAVAILHYERFDLWQAQLMQGASFGKMASADAVLRDVAVRGQPARWLAGESHNVWYSNAAGTLIPGSELIVDRNTLVWRTPRAFYRLETDLPLAEALRIAETLP